jgi:hypothetical protein
MDYFYIFYEPDNDGIGVYGRTIPTEQYAEKRVKELKRLYVNVRWFKNEIPKDYIWLY